MADLLHIPLEILDETPFPLRPVRYVSVEFRELVDSVRTEGVLQPLLVRPKGERYEVVEGGYRRAAAIECKLATVPCLVKDLTDEEVLSIQLQTNAIRPTTQKVEFAERLHWIMEEKQITLPQLAAMLHKSPRWLSDMLLLRKLNAKARDMVNRGEIKVQSAVALARLPLRLQDDFTDLAVTLPHAEFIERCRQTLKNFREWVKTGRTEYNQLRLYEPMPWLRQLHEIHHEAKTCENAGVVIELMGVTTPVDGWRACLAWLLHLDPLSIQKQFDKQERAKHLRLTADQRKQRDREVRNALIKDFKNE